MLARLTTRLRALLFTLVMALVVLAVACGGEAAPTATPIPPTPTPLPDPAALVGDTAANLRALRSTEFEVRHETGAIFVPGFNAKMTDAKGAWDAEAGADVDIDAYLVPDAQTEATSGIYFQLQLVITPDGYFGTDPLSGAWLKQPMSMAPIPVAELNHLIADLVESVANPNFEGQEDVDGEPAYMVAGDAPASGLDWLQLAAEEGQTVRIVVWTGTEDRMLRKMQIIGAIGSFDQEDTVREILLTNINGDVAIEPPAEYLNLAGG